MPCSPSATHVLVHAAEVRVDDLARRADRNQRTVLEQRDLVAQVRIEPSACDTIDDGLAARP